MARKVGLNGIDGNAQQAVNFADGSAAGHLATYGQLLNLVNGRDYKEGVRASSTANVNIASPGATLDGVTLSTGDRVLLKDQSTASQNGIWVFNGSASALTRPADFPTGSGGLVSQGATVVIDEGTVNQAQQWTLTTSGTINVDTTSEVWTRTTAVGTTYTGGNGISVAGTVVSAVVESGAGLALTGAGLKVDRTKVPNLYAANVGDGSATSITVTHNLGTRDVGVTLYDSASYVEVDTDVTHATTNTITLAFASAPASNAYRVVVLG